MFFFLNRMLRYTSRMQLRVNTYVDGDSFVHTCDARVKVLLLCAYTATVFWVETWIGQCLLAGFCLVLALSARVSLGRMLAMGIPVYMMAALTVLFASINNQVGFALGCFYGVRMILLVLGSFIVVLTTTSTALTDALRSFVSPLRVLHVPADDIAMVFSMAIRFIPLMAQEICAIHDAQFSRGASFHRGSLWQRVSAWPPVFIPLFVGMFRRADKLSVAMDARCYGARGCRRTSLRDYRMTTSSVAALAVGLGLLAAIALLL